MKNSDSELSKSAVRSVSHVPSFGKPSQPPLSSAKKPSASSKRELTEFDEFALQSSRRHEISVQALSRSVQQQLDNEKKQHVFHAQPVPKAVFTRPREVCTIYSRRFLVRIKMNT